MNAQIIILCFRSICIQKEERRIEMFVKILIVLLPYAQHAVLCIMTSFTC